MVTKSSKNYKQDADIIIIGGGMNGLTQSILLGQNDFNILCIDSAPEISHKDKRTTAISYGSAEIFKSAGLWTKIEPHACPIKEIKVLDGKSPVLLDFNTSTDFSSEPLEAFGWIVENKYLLDILKNALKDNKQITHLTKQTVNAIEFNDDNVMVITDDGKQYHAQLMIGADGRNSLTRRAAQIKSKKWSYKQKAVICCVQHENPHHNIAIEHFRTHGPFAILPMLDNAKGNHQSAVVWTLEKEEDDALIHNTDVMNAALNERFPECYGHITLASTPKAYPLNFNHAYEYISHRAVLIGDAAHGIHPIAGQGLNIGLQDVRTLTDILASLKNDQKDIGLKDNLAPYQTKRFPENTAMAAATDILNKVFSNNMLSSKILRQHGLKYVKKFAPAKRFFLKRAMGIKDVK